nr:hypothetical protein [Chitinophaga polysaccharea]
MPAISYVSRKIRKSFGETEKVQTIANTEKIQTITNNEFSVSDTVAVNFFRKFRLNSGQLGSLMGALADTDGWEDAAINEWISRNEQLVKEWE